MFQTTNQFGYLIRIITSHVFFPSHLIFNVHIPIPIHKSSIQSSVTPLNATQLTENTVQTMYKTSISHKTF